MVPSKHDIMKIPPILIFLPNGKLDFAIRFYICRVYTVL